MNELAKARAIVAQHDELAALCVLVGAAPAANCTHLWLAEGVTPTLRNVQWKLYSALVAGDRVCVLV